MNKNDPATVLVVDDDPVILELVEEQLTLLGHHSISASSGEAALQVINGKGIDLLLTNFLLPGMNGMELIEQFSPLYPKTKIIIMSGHFPSITSKVISESDFVFMQKPFTYDELHTNIRKILYSSTD